MKVIELMRYIISWVVLAICYPFLFVWYRFLRSPVLIGIARLSRFFYGVKPEDRKLIKYLDEVNFVLVDGLGLGIDKGIRRSVAILRMLGFDTSMSCEGHEDNYVEGFEKWGRYDKDGPYKGVCYPWISFEICEWQEIGMDDLHRIMEYVAEYNDPRIVIEPITGLTLRTKCASLEEGQKIMSDFTEWLLRKYG